MNNFKNCGYYTDGECNICGMGTDGEDTFCKYCKDNPNCYYKQLTILKAENEQLKALCDTYRTCYQAKHSDIKCLLPKYRTTLQEIKDYLNTLSGIDNDFVNTETYLRILDLVTKVEESNE